jgi:hypothetical protein
VSAEIFFGAGERMFFNTFILYREPVISSPKRSFSFMSIFYLYFIPVHIHISFEMNTWFVSAMLPCLSRAKVSRSGPSMVPLSGGANMNDDVLSQL